MFSLPDVGLLAMRCRPAGHRLASRCSPALRSGRWRGRRRGLSLPGLVGLEVAVVAQLVSGPSRGSFDVDPLVAVEATADSRTELLGTTEECRGQLAVVVGGDSSEALEGASDADAAAVALGEDECFAVSATCLVEVADLFGHVTELRQAVRSSTFLVGGAHHRHRPAESIGDRPGRLVAPTSIVVGAGAPVNEPEAVQRDGLGGGQGELASEIDDGPVELDGAVDGRRAREQANRVGSSW